MKLKLSLRRPHDLPFRAPHFVDSLLRIPSRAEGHIVTTLDLPLQSILERQIHSFIERQKRLGIHNASAMLLDTRDMSVRAVVGSASFYDQRILGQVNGTQAKRSPGSTLKPFIYALAIDQGVLHPQTMLKDSQLAFGMYSPENFDGKFAGPLSAQEALVRSRNVPALWVANKLTNPSFYDFLRSGGVTAQSEILTALAHLSSVMPKSRWRSWQRAVLHPCPAVACSVRFASSKVTRSALVCACCLTKPALSRWRCSKTIHAPRTHCLPALPARHWQSGVENRHFLRLSRRVDGGCLWSLRPHRMARQLRW